MSTSDGDVSLDRMVRAVEKVRDRLIRAARVLEAVGIPYAVVGGNAVAAWVSRVDEAAVRNTQDVDVLLQRSDLELAKTALEAAGFQYRHVRGIDMFLDGPGAKARDAVHIVYADEKGRPSDEFAAPSVHESEATPAFRVIALESLVRMKLIAYRDKDRVHLRDLLDVGLIDETWRQRLPQPLGQRLQHIIDTPDG